MTPPEKIRPQTSIEASYNNALKLVADQNATIESLTKRLNAAEKELAAISAAVDVEYNGPKDKRSGDLLDDIGAFLEHHKSKEAELKQLKEANVELVEALRRIEAETMGGNMVWVMNFARQAINAAVEVNEKGAGGYLLARLTDAKAVLEEGKK